MRNPISRSRSGFTLIELLVVIAIIAILAAILFPVFAQAREKARQTSCLSNTKQLGLAFMQYNQDYDEHLPNSYQGNPAGAAPNIGNTCVGDTSGKTGKIGGWMYSCGTTNGITAYDPAQGSINPYTKNSQMFVCPSDSSGQKNSYAINQLVLTNAGDTSGILYGIALASFRGTANTILFAEEEDNGTPKGSNDAYMTVSSQGPFSTDGVDATTGISGGDTGVGNDGSAGTNSIIRHSGGGCYALAYGHSKWFKPAQIKPVYTGGNASAATFNLDVTHHDAVAPRFEP